ncbi:MAG: response regulator [Rhodocyclaceae bacterium]|nr:response regulator [Rhodocyclaceae bacterium]
MAKKNPKKIVIVDDNDVIRTLLRGMLRGEDYEVAGEANSGDLVAPLVQRVQPDAVLLDVDLPSSSGLEVLKSLREQYPSLVVLMVTGHTDRDTVKAAIDNGANGYIVKPFNAGKVLDTIARALEKAKPDQTPR